MTATTSPTATVAPSGSTYPLTPLALHLDTRAFDFYVVVPVGTPVAELKRALIAARALGYQPVPDSEHGNPPDDDGTRRIPLIPVSGESLIPVAHHDVNRIDHARVILNGAPPVSTVAAHDEDCHQRHTGCLGRRVRQVLDD